MAERKARVVRREEWARDERLWRGALEGHRLGTGVTVLFYSTDEVGKGPVLHIHPYDELFIIREGRARFSVGDQVLEAGAGEIVFGPADVPHKFKNIGPGRLETVDIHVNERWIQTDLDDPDP